MATDSTVKATTKYEIKWVTGHFERGVVTTGVHGHIELKFKGSDYRVTQRLDQKPLAELTLGITGYQLDDLIKILSQARRLHQGEVG